MPGSKKQTIIEQIGDSVHDFIDTTNRFFSDCYNA